MQDDSDEKMEETLMTHANEEEIRNDIWVASHKGNAYADALANLAAERCHVEKGSGDQP